MSVTLQARLNRPAIPEGDSASLYLLIQLAAGAAPIDGRPPMNLAAVVDRSGSMGGPKLAYTKQALSFLIDQVDQPDYLSIVTFDDHVMTIFPSDHVVNKDHLKNQVDMLYTGGSTNLSGGMIDGYRQVGRHQTKGWVNRVLLMTDGQANVGVTDPVALTAKVRAMHERGIQLSTLGVGSDFEEDLLTAMAEAGGGNFYYIANPDQIPALFNQELQGLLKTVAQGLTVRFNGAHGVSVVRAIGYAPAGSAEELSIALPDIYAGEVKSLVLELSVEAGFAGDRPIGSIALTYGDALSGADVTVAHDLTIQVTGDSELLGAPDEPEVAKQVYLAQAGVALERAIGNADQLDFEGGSMILTEAAAPLAAMAEATGDGELLLYAQELTERADALGQQRYDAVARKQMKAQSFQARTGRRQEP